MTILLADQKAEYLPGDTVGGTAEWSLEVEPKSAELRLFWYTKGKGTQDVGIVHAEHFENPKRADSRSFSFTLPLGPYTFSGRLISLIWALELIVEPGARAVRHEITVSPTLREVLLGTGNST